MGSNTPEKCSSPLPVLGGGPMNLLRGENNMLLPTIYRFEVMTEVNARAALNWYYDPPYDFYNHDPAKLDELIHSSFLNPAYHYYSVLDEKDLLIAFRCFGEDAQVPGGDYSADALDMGGGLQPDLTGQGIGPQIMLAAMQFARTEYSPRAFRATIARFNVRARRACEKVGYVIQKQFIATHSGMPFVILIRSA
jgi:[ribosomal protein S18]-alanine N-acetyltransferase